MKKDELKRIAQRPDLIPGIYNYCNRWCERCPFTARCMNFAMEEARAAPAAGSMQDPDLWDEMSSVFDLTLELVRESAAQQGIDIDSLEMDDAMEVEERRALRAAELHPIARAAFAYIDMADGWLERADEHLEETLRTLEQSARLELPGSRPQDEADRLADALAVVSWHHTLIYPKLMRALGQSPREQTGEDAEDFAGDSDGSAKVALLSIDDSIAAWEILREHLADESDTILDMLAHLERLRNATEKEFPHARAFQRIGFDYLPAQER